MLVVTGATGQLGRLVVQELRQRVPAAQIVAAARTPQNAADLGVEVREADYDRPETLKAALAGATKVLLISGTAVGSRLPQHAAVVDAAKEAGATLLYTSTSAADSTQAVLAADHRETEAYITASGVPHTILRTSWYHENYADPIRSAAASGTLYGSAGDGRVASAARADFAAAAAAVLATEGHEGEVYELSGDTAFSYAELAAEIAKAAGRDVAYRNLPEAEYAGLLAQVGLPAPYPEILADVDTQIAGGWLAGTPGTLRGLIGRPTQPIGAYVRSLLG